MKTALAPHSHGEFFGPAFRSDPFSVYARYRAHHPIVWEESLKAYVVTRAADVEEVLKDAATFSSNRVDVARRRFTDPALQPLFDTLSLLMLQRDDPDHRRLRKLVAKAFARTAVEAYGEEINALAQELLKPAIATGRMDFVGDFAVPLPILIISRIVGIPPEDRETVKAWCDAFSVVALNFYAKISPEALEEGRVAVEAFREYLARRVEVLRAAPDASLLSALVDAEEDGDRLTMDELLANVLLLLNAGNETTTILLSNGLHDLACHSDVAARLRADPSLIPLAVEEMLRFEAPVHFLGRIATKDTRLAGVPIEEGAVVLVFLASAGRDERAFEAADTFDPSREPNHHQAFGNGRHLCAGVQLARFEAQIAFEAVLAAFSDITLEADRVEYGPNSNLRSISALPLRVTPA